MSVVVSQLNRAVPQVALEAITTARRFRYTNLFALPGNQNVVNGLFSPFTATSDCGWWGNALSDADGFLPEAAILTVTKRTAAYSFELTGVRNNYPVDFDLILYLDGEEQTRVLIRDNAESSKRIVLDHAYDIDRYDLVITRISVGNDVLKVSTASFDVGLSNLMKAPERQIRGRVEVTYINALRDSKVTTNAGAYASSGEQLNNGLIDPSAKFFKLYSNTLDGTCRPIGPQSNVGWWPKALPDGFGSYAEPQVLSIRFSKRNVYGFSIYCDPLYDSYSVDFTISVVRGSSSTVIKTVTGHNVPTYHVSEYLLDIDGIDISISRVSKPFKPAVVMEVSIVTSIVYEADRLIDMTMLEELSYEDSLEKLGGVSANELTVTFSNEDHSFDFNNTDSIVAGYLKKHRRIRAWLGVDIPGETEEPTIELPMQYLDTTLDLLGNVYGAADDECCLYLTCPLSVSGTDGEVLLKVNESMPDPYVEAIYHDGTIEVLSNVMCSLDSNCCLHLTGPLAVREIDEAIVLELDPYYDTPETLTPAFSNNTLWTTLGTFWTHSWTVPARGLTAKAVAFDTLGLLSTKTFYDHTVYRNKSIGWLVDTIMTSAAKQLSFIEWSVDTELYDIIIPIAWFNYASYTAALNRIASCDLINIYCDRDGRLLVKKRLGGIQSPDDVWSDDTNIIDKTYPTLNTAPANYIDVKVSRVIVEQQNVLDISDLSDNVQAGENRLFNFSSPAESVVNIAFDTTATYTYTVYSWGISVVFTSAGVLRGINITANALSVDTPTSIHLQNDEAIEEEGVIACEVTSDFIQTQAHANRIATYLYSNLARSIYDVEVTYRGDAAVTLNSKISLPEGLAPNNLYAIKRHELYWNGSLRGTATLST